MAPYPIRPIGLAMPAIRASRCPKLKRINAQPLPAHRPSADDNEIGYCRVVVWVRSFIEPDLFDNNVGFDNTTPIYLINLLWKLGLDLLQLHCFRIFFTERFRFFQPHGVKCHRAKNRS